MVWENALRKSEQLHEDAAINYYFFGRKEPGATGAKSNRLVDIIDEIGDDTISDGALPYKHGKLLGIESVPSPYVSSEDEFSDEGEDGRE